MEFFVRLLNRLSHDTATRVGASLGIAAFHLGLRRATVRRLMGECLGLKGQERRRLARQAYATMGANFLEVWTIGGPDGLEKHCRMLNPGWLQHLQRRHNGLIFVTPHLGNWEAEAIAAKPFLPRVMVYAKEQSPGVDRVLTECRSFSGVEVHLARRGNRTSVLSVLRVLRDKGALGLTADQRPFRGEGVAASFLGKPAWCHGSPAYYAQRLKLPVIPAFALRSRTGDNVVFSGRPVSLEGLDEAAATARVMDLMSAAVAAFPGQYFWHHERFRRAPDEAPADNPRWRTGLRFLAAPLLALAILPSLTAVEDPLTTASAVVAPEGTLALRVGASYWKEEPNWLLGGTRDSYQAPIIAISGSPSARVSLDLSWPIWVGMIHDDTNGSRTDFGDATIGTTFRAMGGAEGGVIGLRSSVSLPQTDYGQGLGTDTTRWTGLLLLGWGYGPTRLDTQVGLSIQQVPDPASTKGQNDLIPWGVALSHTLAAGPVLLAEATGLDGPQDAGAGPHGEVRAGFRLPLPDSLVLDAAVRRGTTSHDGTWGGVAGLTWITR